MKHYYNTSLAIILATMLLQSTLLAQEEKTISKTFDDGEQIRIDLVLGNCTISESNDGKTHVRVDYTYDDYDFEAYIEKHGRKIIIEEDFNNNRRNHNSDYSNWKIEIPNGMDINFESATGNLKIDGVEVQLDGNSGTGDLSLNMVKGEFDLNSGTGNLMIKDSEGKFQLNSGTGDVEAERCSGNFDANSGTGDVMLMNISFTGKSSLNSGTGDVQVKMSSQPKRDIELNSGTGDAVLNLGGIEPAGEFLFTCNEDRGRIKSPIEFDKERTVRENGNYISKKSFTKGSADIRFEISTGTGTAELELD